MRVPLDSHPQIFHHKQVITTHQAREYAQLLHPAFAGYYHDGIISETDALAAVFYLIKGGFIEPEFKNHNITQGLSYLRRSQRQPPTRFEQNIIKIIFYDSDRVSTQTVGSLIKDHAIQSLIAPAATNNVKALTLPTAARDQTVKVYSVHKDNRKLINVVTREKSTQAITGCILVLLALIYYFNGMRLFSLILGLIGLVSALMAITGIEYGRITSSHVSVHPYTDYYHKLHEFLQVLPPEPHTFTYEFIPYAIAFGLDTSWHADFGLPVSPQIPNKQQNVSIHLK